MHLSHTLSAAHDALSTLPTTPFPLATFRPAESSSITRHAEHLAAGKSLLQEGRASLAAATVQLLRLQDELATARRGYGIVGVEHGRLEKALAELKEGAVSADERRWVDKEVAAGERRRT